MAEPKTNDYVITVVVSDVKKVVALKLAREIKWLASETRLKLGDVSVITSHVKDLI